MRLPPPGARAPGRRGWLAAAVAWLPLLVLSALSTPGLSPALAGRAFLLDLAAQGRYLVALPLLLAAEDWCLRQLASVVRAAVNPPLMPADAAPRAREVLRDARALLAHPAAERMLVLAAYAVAVLLGGLLYPRQAEGWAQTGGALTPAGWWQMLVSQPLFLVVLYGWLWRVIVWARLLARIARLPLALLASHPDGAAGLRFLSLSLRAFAPVALALAAVVSCTLAGEMRAHRAPPRVIGYGGTAAVAAAITMVVFAGPLAVFVPALHRARTDGIVRYGALASELGRRFEARWLRRGAVDGNALAAPDFSAFNDLSSVAGNPQRMVPIPILAQDLAILAAAALLPFLPLVFLEMPFGAAFKRIAGILF